MTPPPLPPPLPSPPSSPLQAASVIAAPPAAVPSIIDRREIAMGAPGEKKGVERRRSARGRVGPDTTVHKHQCDTSVHRRLSTVINRKSTRLNSSHVSISYAVFCFKKKKYTYNDDR